MSSSTYYVVKAEDERLDRVVYEHYGHLHFIFQVLEDNPTLIKNIFLPFGYEVLLKSYVLDNDTEENQNNSDRLWL